MRAWLGVDPGKHGGYTRRLIFTARVTTGGRMRYSWQLGQGGGGERGTDTKRG